MLSLTFLALLTSLALAAEKKVKILATTDVHGYVYGHTDQPGVYVDFGDFRRFTECVETQNSDHTLLRLDSGDLIQGTGLSDFTNPPGSVIYDVFSMFGYDGTTIGNHDAGEPSSMDYIVENNLTDMFISGNVFYSNDAYDDSTNPCTYEDANLIAKPYKVLERDGMVFLILGFLYGATTEDNVCNLNLSGFFESKYWGQAQDEVSKATKSKGPDFVITLNHISSQDDQQVDIYNNIRAVYKDSMFVMLNGHSHREEEGMCRDSASLSTVAVDDDNCVYMEAGCYMYSIGAITLTLKDGVLVDKQLEHYEAQYTVLEEKCPGFTTVESEIAKKIDDYIDLKINELGVLDIIGISNWFYDKDLIQTSPSALWRLYYDAAIPTELYSLIENYPGLPKGEKMLFINAGSLRKDLAEGPIMKENISNVLPFKNVFVYLDMTLKGSDLKLVYEDINYREDIHDNEIDYYLVPLVYDNIDDDEEYTIISSNYDCVKVSSGIYYMLHIDVQDRWTEIVGDGNTVIPNMMEVLENYITKNFNDGFYENNTIDNKSEDMDNLKNEDVVYITLMVIFGLSTLIAQLIAGKRVSK